MKCKQHVLELAGFYSPVESTAFVFVSVNIPMFICLRCKHLYRCNRYDYEYVQPLEYPFNEPHYLFPILNDKLP